jgi:transcriptional regulator with XRE-family HTH domain
MPFLDGAESIALRLRREGGWSREEVAAAAGCSWRQVMRLERGEVARMQLGLLVRMAEALGVSAAELLPALAWRPAVGRLKRLGFGSEKTGSGRG